MKLLFLSLFLFCLSLSVNSQNSKIAVGQWKVLLQLNDTIQLPFQLNINNTQQNQYEFTIINASESIQIKKYYFKNDSLFIELPVFNSYFELAIIDSTSLKGVWRNLAKGPDYIIPASANKSNEKRFLTPSSKFNSQFNGKYETTFIDDTESYKATGLFSQTEDKLTGTFLTETGDYRYLEGVVSENTVYLSCFDGSHAFYFSGVITEDTITGVFFSGSHYNSNWKAFKNKEFQLTPSNSITKIVNPSDIRFTLPDLDSTLFTFPNNEYKDKVVIIQIMGSWCPNCMDETRMYKELYNKYNKKGLEIITIAFEVNKEFSKKVAAVTKLKEHFNIQYKLLLANDFKKETAAKLFSNLNGISSFPTSIFIDKNNKVRRIHTGFSGPGTGEIYQNYLKETSLFIEDLLKE